MTRTNNNNVIKRKGGRTEDFGLDFQVIGGSEAKERKYRSPKTISAAAKAAIELFSMETM
ncbi:hypothetical protein IJH16_03325 [Candidatus Saccharibacteria bacterium]|nr:hypothetical protein [Candidatus Saccharibacteria bacterium]MBR5408558.1 hypothetical protein [Candidatus Saccharibacteria bacterium]